MLQLPNAGGARAVPSVGAMHCVASVWRVHGQAPVPAWASVSLGPPAAWAQNHFLRRQTNRHHRVRVIMMMGGPGGSLLPPNRPRPCFMARSVRKASTPQENPQPYTSQTESAGCGRLDIEARFWASGRSHAAGASLFSLLVRALSPARGAAAGLHSTISSSARGKSRARADACVSIYLAFLCILYVICDRSHSRAVTAARNGLATDHPDLGRSPARSTHAPTTARSTRESSQQQECEEARSRHHTELRRRPATGHHTMTDAGAMDVADNNTPCIYEAPLYPCGQVRLRSRFD